MTTPMQRTRAELKKHGIVNGIVERYFPKSKKYPFGHKEDFLNIIDIIGLDHGVVGYQICGTDYQPHIRKITEEKKENTIAWLMAGARLELWGWRQLKRKRGGKALYWSPRIADILLVDGLPYVEER